jgi:hypothetical protein
MAIVQRPEAIGQIVDDLLKQSPDEAHHALVRTTAKPAEPFTLKPGETRYGADAKPIASVPLPAKEPKQYPITVAGPDGRPMQKLVTADELAQGVPAYREPKEPKEAQRFWVMRDGQPVRITEAQYRPGDKPANTREQGRPVTSGDANRVADFDTSLDDLAVLNHLIAPQIDPATGKEIPGATGTSAKIGASLPNWVTNITGWGTDAKSKQAVIDRVKQVIGKALEGGVLRKEDEYKYEKILPTIGDPQEVVTAKLAGLDAAIRQRRQTLLDSLEDANYDVSRYRARPEHGQNGGDGEGAGRTTPPARLTRVIRNKTTGEQRQQISTDGGKTWR